MQATIVGTTGNASENIINAVREGDEVALSIDKGADLEGSGESTVWITVRDGDLLGTVGGNLCLPVVVNVDDLLGALVAAGVLVEHVGKGGQGIVTSGDVDELRAWVRR